MLIALTALVAVILALILLAGHLGIRGMALLLLLCVVVFTGLFTVRVVSIDHAVSNEQRVQASLTNAEVSNEQMWEKINRPKIDLSEDTKIATVNSIKKKPEAKKTSQDELQTTSKKPDWAGVSHHRVGNVLRKVVVSDPYAETEECYQALQDGTLREAVNQRLDELAPNRYRPSLERLGLGPEFIWRDVCNDEWVETLDTSVGEMKRVHVLLEFDPSVDRELSKAYFNYERKFRIQEVGGIAGLGLGSLALLFGLLKVDTWTKGYYSKRLFFGVPAVIIAIVALIN